MSCGSLPPVPGLIPISALRLKSAPARSASASGGGSRGSNNNADPRECTPCAAVQKEVMGEQRSRRTGSQPPVDLIDIARRSRGPSATPQAPSGKAERHRKSDRRRGEHRGGRKRSASKRCEDKCVNPRVNPIFVWVRQEDTHIVDVKCEDYDKRNRIVLTKTAQGWRAIPRTETLVPSLKAAAADAGAASPPHQERKLRKSHHKIKRRSAGVQVDEAVHVVHDEPSEPPIWSVPVNVESHLPSHTIQVHRKRSLSPVADDAAANVNTSVERGYSAQAPVATECSASKICDVSPLDNLLAVAELEFNQQIQTEAWCEAAAAAAASASHEDAKECDDNDDDVNVLVLKSDECNDTATQQSNATIGDLQVMAPGEAFDSEEEKDDNCDYNEDDENNLAMDDILNRLEQSLQSPDVLCAETSDSAEQKIANEVPDYESVSSEEKDEKDAKTESQKEEEEEEEEESPACDLSVGSTITTAPAAPAEPIEDAPTDLSTSKRVECLTISLPDEDLMPTDLSLPKNKSKNPTSPRPSSRCSETIQSPQPSGLPAVPHSPDVHTSTAAKTAYLESLLSSTSQKIPLNSEVTITRQKEPLDFGKCRKSASPTVTCSEEVNSSSGEPEAKKPKLDITLRTILDANLTQQPGAKEQQKGAKGLVPETSRLLELLTSESEPDALTQLKQLHSDPHMNLPDPMLVPKERLSQILMSPGKEIPRLLAHRPELRLPEALAFPHLLQDPDILVITLAQLETIIRKQTLAIPVEKAKQSVTSNSSVVPGKKAEPEGNVKERAAANPKHHREHNTSRHKEPPGFCGDVNLTNSNALNQMMWLPYLQQLEMAALAFGNGTDFLKMISSAFPPYSNQVPDMSQVFAMNRFPQPPGFPAMQPPANPFEFPIWHEAAAAAQAGVPSSRPASSQFERPCSKNAYREYVEKMSTKGHHLPTPGHKYPSSVGSKGHPPFNQSLYQHNVQHPFLNVPPAYQPSGGGRHNLQVPQFGSMLSQKNPGYAKANGKTSPTSSSASYGFYASKAASQRCNSYSQKLGAAAAASHKAKPLAQENSGLKKGGATDALTQPMDLSGAASGKARVAKQGFCSDSGFAKSLKFDDVPEVGSTTANIEDMTAHMQESQKHLWHPLFGNQKSSSSPWNWSTVTATGE